MDFMSISSGTFFISHFSRVRSVASSIGSAAFYEPLITVCPERGLPPRIIKLSIVVVSVYLLTANRNL